jgi:germination protein M
MNRIRGSRRKTRLLSAMVLLLPLLSACGAAGGQDQKKDPIDAPPTEVEQTMLQQSGSSTDAGTTADSGAKNESGVKNDSADTAASVAPANVEDGVTVYLRDRNGYLAPMTLHLPSGDSADGKSAVSMAKTALTWLTQDTRRTEQLPAGFTAVVPEGMKADSVKLDTKTGTVSIDFAAPLAGMTASQERKMIEALVWTMTELPGMEKVRLSVAGKPIRVLPTSDLPVDEVLTRGFGINLEAAQGVHMMRSMPVTLYFAANTDNGDGYFVPVTRLVDRTSDRMGAALGELIKGPSDNQALHAVLPPGITVEKHSQKDNTVNVALHEEGWSADTAVPSEMMEALVLTMTETTGAPQVKVAMNGSNSFVDSDSRSYDQPVTRPVAVNVLKR